MEDINAIVLCGGKGSRMNNITELYKCKSLVPIYGVPCLSYVLEALKQINCSKSILCIDRQELYLEVKKIGELSGINFEIFQDSGLGPTHVVIESLAHITSSRFLVLNGHQIVFPDFLTKLIELDKDFIATIYMDSTEATRKIATLDSNNQCIRIRKGSANNPAHDNEVYLDKPYILHTETLRKLITNKIEFAKGTPVDSNHRDDSILRYANDMHTLKATFRHEFHYEYELEDVKQLAEIFKSDYLNKAQ
jgi:NDP-sugar pyrophosphorylase family protein